jgi:hypothetical protein
MLLMALPLFLLIASCQKKIKGEEVTPVGAPSPVELRFKGIYDRLSNLKYDSVYSHNEPIDPLGFNFIKFTTLKYYISNMSFVNDNGDTIKIPDTYFLIDHSKPELSRALLTVPAGSYYGMSFMLGVDSARSLNGPRTGALDPALNMFWNPTDGYVHGMIEGFRGTTPLPNERFSFRVGGYRAPYSTLARRHFKLGGNALVSPNRKVVINITADAVNWFRGNRAPFATMPIIDGPGPQAQELSQNYYAMFTFISVTYE